MTRFRGQMTIDELLLHPREAMLFCDEVRHSLANFFVPDHFILRAILTRRKTPNTTSPGFPLGLFHARAVEWRA